MSNHQGDDVNRRRRLSEVKQRDLIERMTQQRKQAPYPPRHIVEGKRTRRVP